MSTQNPNWPRDGRNKPVRRIALAKYQPGAKDASNLYVRYDQRYEVGVRDSSGRLNWYLAETISEAKRIRDEKLVKRHRHDPEPTNRALKFDEAADNYMAALNRRTNTVATYSAALTHLRKAFGPRRLTSIDANDVRRYIAEHRGLAGWTLRVHRTALSGVFKHAGLPSPTKGVAAQDWPETGTGGKVILNDAQLGDLILNAPDRARTYLAVLAQTGMRKSEALGLTYADLREGAIHVGRQRDRYTGRRAPQKNSRKRYAERDVTVSRALILTLRRRQLDLGADEHEFVFADLDYHVVDRLWVTARRRARLDGIKIDGEIIEPAMRLHDLRHTHVSSLIAKSWDAGRIAARIGDSIATVLGTYAHEFDAGKHDEADREEFAEQYAGMLGVTS